ncbi:hypothetical protein HK104_009134 [Borealophlyctis nickersoniae]|nr:hypothetical protein HK104_009134 [Borealophlyctis nickersoniae]
MNAATERDPLLSRALPTLPDTSPQETDAGHVTIDATIYARQVRITRRLKTLFVSHLIPILLSTYYLIFHVLPNLPNYQTPIYTRFKPRTAALLLLITPYVALLCAVAGWWRFRPPTDPSKAPQLPVSAWQWWKIRRHKCDDKIIELATWWCEHPASLRRRAEGATCASLANQTTFPLHAIIPTAILLIGRYFTSVYGWGRDKYLHWFPIEGRGDPTSPNAVRVPIYDLEDALEAEEGRWDCFGVFPESWAYWAAELSLLVLVAFEW